MPLVTRVDPKQIKPASAAAQALGWIDEKTRAVSPPIHTATTYIRDEDNQYRSGRGYIRADNPSFDQAEALLGLKAVFPAALAASPVFRDVVRRQVRALADRGAWGAVEGAATA